MKTANQAKRREGGTDRKGLRDEGMGRKSKTDLMFPCLVCHGTLAAPDPAPAIFSLPLTFLSRTYILLFCQSSGRLWDSSTVGSL